MAFGTGCCRLALPDTVVAHRTPAARRRTAVSHRKPPAYDVMAVMSWQIPLVAVVSARAEQTSAERGDPGETSRDRVVGDVTGHQPVSQQPGDGFVEIAGGQLQLLAGGDVNTLGHRPLREPSQACRSQGCCRRVQGKAALTLHRQEVAGGHHRQGSVVALQ